MENREVFMDTEEITEYLFSSLLKRGIAINVEDAEEIADIIFEFLIEKNIIEEEE